MYMQPVRRLAPFPSARRRQRGQALIYGMFVLVGGLAALLFFFNVGQLSREKTKLVNAADAAAYSAGLVHARTLNFTAYGNRALVANEVLVAQMVSLSSWAKYVDTWNANLTTVHPECDAIAQAGNGNYWAAFFGAVAAMRKFGPEYVLACGLMANPTISSALDTAVDAFPPLVGAVVTAVEINKAAIRAAQWSVHNPAVFAIQRLNVMQTVAQANYAGDGQVQVNPLTPGLPDEWFNSEGAPFVRLYQDNERTRFREIARTAAFTDPFVQSRSWTSTAILPEPSCLQALTIRFNEVRRRGGTELLGFDEWQAVDTQSYHENFLAKGKVLWSCDRRENVTGYGEQQAYANDQSPGSTTFGRSRNDNPRTHGVALSTSSDEYTQYTGLPSYYDLNAVWITGQNRDAPPTLRHGVRVVRARTELRTTDGGNGQIRTRADSRIGAYNSALAGGEMAAVSASEVFFERPTSQVANVFGLRSSRPVELGSLFNPYWQVRLIGIDITSQWLRQGVTVSR